MNKQQCEAVIEKLGDLSLPEVMVMHKDSREFKYGGWPNFLSRWCNFGANAKLSDILSKIDFSLSDYDWYRAKTDPWKKRIDGYIFLCGIEIFYFLNQQIDHDQ